MADAAPEASDAFAGDERDQEEAAELERCDGCGELVPSYDLALVWCGPHDALICGWCQDTSPRVDRQIDLMRGK
jgi:hypothetical protein